MLTEVESLPEQALEYAALGAAETGLTNGLSGLTKTKLAALATAYQIAGRSKMNKEQLAEALAEQIANPEKLASVLLVAREEEWKLFNRLLTSPVMQDDAHALNEKSYGYLTEYGLVFVREDRDALILILPDEVKEAFHKLNKKPFKQLKARYDLVHSYVTALVNLYGAYKPARLLEIFNAQNEDETLDAEELEQLLKSFSGREQTFGQTEEYIADISLLVDGTENLEKLLAQAVGKPYYVPEKDELLNHKDEAYYEMTPQLSALRDFIYPKFCSDQESAETFMSEIRFAAAAEQPLQLSVDRFAAYGMEFETLDQAQKAAALISDVHHHTRLWSNGGYTPAEMKNKFGQVIKALHTTHYFPNKKQQVTVTKIGRNEACPCGSGLKYKKCCGK